MDRKKSEVKFGPSSRMRELIRFEPMLLMVLRRFNISLGFGNATVAEVCGSHNVHTSTFLAVAAFVSGVEWHQFEPEAGMLITYLKNSHDYFLSFALPSIRRKLLAAVPVSNADDIGMLLLRYYDDYVEEVRAHMQYENDFLFPYVEDMLKGVTTETFDLSDFSLRHAPIAPKLEELKEIFVTHYQNNGDEDALNAALFDIITCERDLMSHCDLEDRLFVPAVEKLKRDLAISPRQTRPASDSIEEDNTPELTSREKDVVRMIALGLANKEIADRLCVSIHTVTTHRRNICAKLDIHSASALTIYAIIQKLININEIKK